MCFKLGSAYPKLICIGGGGGAWPGATLHLQALQGWARHFKLPRSLWSMYHEGSSSPPSTAVVNSEKTSEWLRTTSLQQRQALRWDRRQSLSTPTPPRPELPLCSPLSIGQKVQVHTPAEGQKAGRKNPGGYHFARFCFV